MRLWFAVMAFAALGIGRASAEDNGDELFQKFAKTCAAKPLSGAELDARARGLGYLSRNGSYDPDDGKRDLDFVYHWKLPDGGVDFAISAYFTGPRTHYQVVCSIRSNNVDFEALVAELKRNSSLPTPQVKSSEGGAPIYTWTLDADGGKDILEIGGFGEDRRRVGVSLTDEVIAR